MLKKLLCFMTCAILIVPMAWSKTPPQKSLNSKMKQTGKALSALLPFLYDYDQFIAPSQKGAVLGHIKNYVNSIHNISPQKIKATLGDDPLANLALRELKGNVNKALAYFKNGQYGYSRRILKSSTSSCFSCHTRLPKGKTDYFWKNLDIKSYKMKPVAKAQLYVAMRKYADAKTFIRQTLSTSAKKAPPAAVEEQLIHLFMFISLRGEDKSAEALKFVRSQTLNKNLSTPFRKSLLTWQQDLKAWSNTKSRSTLTVKALLGVKKDRITAVDAGSAVKQIIASKLLHQQLMAKESNARTSEAYLYLGQVYDHLIEGQFWELPELYYEACIENSPGQAIALTCFKFYKEDITAGFTGSSGTQVPAEAKKKMSTLRALALGKPGKASK